MGVTIRGDGIGVVEGLILRRNGTLDEVCDRNSGFFSFTLNSYHAVPACYNRQPLILLAPPGPTINPPISIQQIGISLNPKKESRMENIETTTAEKQNR
jgi:hypothetical protein